MTQGNLPACGICGQPSITWFRNVKAAPPTLDEKTGRYSANWEYDGEGQYRCETHGWWGWKTTPPPMQPDSMLPSHESMSSAETKLSTMATGVSNENQLGYYNS